MNVFVLNQAFQYVDDKYLDIVEQERTVRAGPGNRLMPYSRRQRARRMRKHLLGERRRAFDWSKAVVACFCLILILAVLPIVAIAANWFGLKDLLIPKSPYDPPVQGEEHSGNVQPVPESGMPVQSDKRASELIGLSGYQGSAEAQALAEWQAFLAAYDTDHAILDELGNGPAGIDESRYGLYGVYTQDMADQLEEIVRKYGLKLHTDINVVSQEELAFRVGGDFMQDELIRYWAYIYEDGTFQFDGDMELQDHGTVACQFTRKVKGTFDESILNISDVTDYQEFEYVTSGGETVMLALGSDKALVYMDSENCFILMNVLGGSHCGVTEDVLKNMAEFIDFALLKDVRTPEMRGDSVP